MVFGGKSTKETKGNAAAKASLPISKNTNSGEKSGSRSEAEALLSADRGDLEKGPKTPKNDHPKTPKGHPYNNKNDDVDDHELSLRFATGAAGLTAKEEEGEEEGAAAATVEYLVRLKAETSPTLLRYLSATVLVFSFFVALHGIVRAQGLRFLIQCLYQASLTFMALLFELNEKEWTYPPGLKGVRNSLRVTANFLTRSLGRGSLYVFLSSLWLWYCWSLQSKGVHLTTAAMLLLIGALNGAAFTFGLTKLDVEVLDKCYLPAAEGQHAPGEEPAHDETYME